MDFVYSRRFNQMILRFALSDYSHKMLKCAVYHALSCKLKILAATKLFSIWDAIMEINSFTTAIKRIYTCTERQKREIWRQDIATRPTQFFTECGNFEGLAALFVQRLKAITVRLKRSQKKLASAPSNDFFEELLVAFGQLFMNDQS